MKPRPPQTAAIAPLFLMVFFSTFLIALQERPEDEYTKAAVLVDENRFESAITVYQALLKTFSSFSETKKSRILNNLGYCHYKLERYDEAYVCYLKALEIDRNYLLCLNNISAVLIKQNKYKEALTHLQKAFALDSQHVKVIFNLFVAYANLEDKDSAARYLKLAFGVDKDYTTHRLKMKNLSEKNIARILAILEVEDKGGTAQK